MFCIVWLHIVLAAVFWSATKSISTLLAHQQHGGNAGKSSSAAGELNGSLFFHNTTMQPGDCQPTTDSSSANEGESGEVQDMACKGCVTEIHSWSSSMTAQSSFQTMWL